MTKFIPLAFLPKLDAQNFLELYDGNSDEVPRKLLKSWIAKAERLNNIERTKGHEALQMELNKYSRKNRKRTESINSNSSYESNSSNSSKYGDSYYIRGISYADMLKSNI